MKKEEQVYELLRSFHSRIKSLLNENDCYGETHNNCGGKICEVDPKAKFNNKQINALEGLHSVLYMVEGEFTDF